MANKKALLLILLVPLLIINLNQKPNLEDQLISNWNLEEKNFNDVYLNPAPQAFYLPSPQQTKITYRKLDSYFALQLIPKSRKLEKLREETKKILLETAPLWENLSIQVSKNDYKGEVWLDSYCMLSLFTNNSAMKSNIVNHLDFNKSLWIDNRLYGEGFWRTTSDETWCIESLMNYNRSLSEKLIYLQIDEMKKSIENSDSFNKMATYIHAISLLNYAKELEYPGFEDENKKLVDASLFQLKESGFEERLDLLSNIVWAYKKSGFRIQEIRDLEDIIKEKSKTIKENYPKQESFIILQVLKALYA